MANMDIDNDFLELFYGITNKAAPQNPTLADLKHQLVDIVDVLKELNKTSKKPHFSKSLGNEDEATEDVSRDAILVIDDLGVITYQLKVLLSEFDMDVDCSQEIYDAVAKYKKRNYSYVVMDLFIPTEREGFILLSELRKMSNSNPQKTVLGVITASPRKEIEQQCKARGADFFIEKSNDWQSRLLATMHEYIDKNEEDEDDF